MPGWPAAGWCAGVMVVDRARNVGATRVEAASSGDRRLAGPDARGGARADRRDARSWPPLLCPLACVLLEPAVRRARLPYLPAVRAQRTPVARCCSRAWSVGLSAVLLGGVARRWFWGDAVGRWCWEAPDWLRCPEVGERGLCSPPAPCGRWAVSPVMSPAGIPGNLAVVGRGGIGVRPSPRNGREALKNESTRRHWTPFQAHRGPEARRATGRSSERQ